MNRYTKRAEDYWKEQQKFKGMNVIFHVKYSGDNFTIGE